jgi:hypothetical protein
MKSSANNLNDVIYHTASRGEPPVCLDITGADHVGGWWARIRVMSSKIYRYHAQSANWIETYDKVERRPERGLNE